MYPFPVQVDHRESSGAVAALLNESPDFLVTVTHLRLGDYLVDGRFLFERKTVPDLMLSIDQGRLFEQALRLTSSFLRTAVILEGLYQEPPDPGVRRERVLGAVATLTLFMGVPVLLTRTPCETVRTMLYAARQANAIATHALPRHGYRPRGKRARQLFILQGLPGVGPERARLLLDRFGSVGAVMSSSAAELASVTRIGKEIARKIRFAIEEPPSEYN